MSNLPANVPAGLGGTDLTSLAGKGLAGKGLPALAGFLGLGTGLARRFTCVSGIVTPRPEIGIPFRGTHLLVDRAGRTIASLRSGTVGLDRLVGQFTTVCGILEPEVEGVRPLLVTAAFPGAGIPQVPVGFPPGFGKKGLPAGGFGKKGFPGVFPQTVSPGPGFGK